MKNVPRLLRNLVSVSAAQILGYVTSAVTTVVLARALALAEFGLYAWVLAAYSLMRIVLNLGLESLATREMSRDRESTSYWLTFITSVKFFLAVAAMTATSLLGNTIGAGRRSSLLLVMVSLALVFDALLESVNPLLASRNRFSSLAAFNASGVLLSSMFLVTAALLGVGVEGLVVAFLLAKATHVAIAGALFATTGEPIPIPFRGVRKLPLQRLATLSWPFLLTSSFSILYAKVDVVMLGMLSTQVEVAFYSSSGRFLGLLVAVASSAAAVFYPPMAVLGRTKPRVLGDTLDHLLRLATVAAVLMSLALWTAAQPLIVMLFGTRYLPAAEVLGVLAWLLIPATAIRLLSNALLAMDRERSAVGVGIVAVGSNVILNLVLIPRLGAAGAAIASLSAEWLVLMTYLLCLRDVGVPTTRLVTMMRAIVVSGVAVLIASIGFEGLSRLLPGVVAFATFAATGGIGRTDLHFLRRILREGFPQG